MINEDIICMPVDTCACCSARGTKIHDDIQDRIFGAPGKWSIMRCTNGRCGLGWLNPQPEKSELYKLYATYYTHANDVGPDPAPPLTSQSEKSVEPDSGGKVRDLLARIMPWRHRQFRSGLCYLEDRTPGKVLEVGCGDGAFLAQMAQAGWQAVGIDFDEKAVAAARRHAGIDVMQGDLIACAFPDASFDAIVMNNVIEHLPDTLAVMKECARILRPGGRVVMVTPNLDAPGHRKFGPDWRGLEVPRHLYLFTTRTLKRYARAAGFATVQSFSPIGGGGTDGIVAMSQMIAERSGRVPPPADPWKMQRYSRIATLLGKPAGEWVVLIAEH
ncbi:class I SAM-dependent methyltransferase [Sphingomonas mollis]|uniref:Class I SAM-dependent methyltransferase n=1 Tax=Sphingomonas mollis TaxID=2795726 RepID=A0ABS0XQ33_9SPHN|nr:class I SAM-dependent methyltransferase [Sphingomonas sp. BT553]MBJ6122138.1 class I SAM-dependent methyltransferase [Sphingomonas sp. BT553]